MNYEEALDWLYSTQLFGIKLGLENMRKLLREGQLFPGSGVRVLHVAGTNGKGSVCAFADSIARASGERCALFTSPHLVCFRERIRVNGEMIREAQVAEGLSELRHLVSDWETHPTFFELSLALAMRHFKEHACKVLVLETGMGGRLDATTAVPADVCVLTPISVDHQKWLGSSVKDIAREKAGIFLKGKPAICSAQPLEVRNIIEQEANSARVSSLRFVEEPLSGYSVALPGRHQLHNAALALEAVHALGVPLNCDIVRRGLGEVNWPGRFEVSSPPKGLPYEELIFDVAHNPAAMRVFTETYLASGRRKATVIFGSVADKDFASSLRLLKPITRELLLVPVSSSRAIPPAELAAAVPQAVPHRILSSPGESLKVLSAGHTLVICGSAFLVGEAKALLSGKDFASSSQ